MIRDLFCFGSLASKIVAAVFIFLVLGTILIVPLACSGDTHEAIGEVEVFPDDNSKAENEVVESGGGTAPALPPSSSTSTATSDGGQKEGSSSTAAAVANPGREGEASGAAGIEEKIESHSLGDEMTITLPGSSVTMTLIFIPAGSFMMGAPAPDLPELSEREAYWVKERGAKDNRKKENYDWSLHEVTLTKGYWIGKTEVTQEQFAAVLGPPPNHHCSKQKSDPRTVFGFGVGPNYPIYCVTFDDVGRFVDKLNSSLGTTAFRLPTEAEWERAARAGTTTRFSYGDVPRVNCESTPFQYWWEHCHSKRGMAECAPHDPYMWWKGNVPGVKGAKRPESTFLLYDDTGSRGAQPVGMKQPNGFGLYDVHGNVSEFVQDRWTRHLGYLPVTDPDGAAEGDTNSWFGIARGGDWESRAERCTSYYRDSSKKGGSSTIGFRLARSP